MTKKILLFISLSILLFPACDSGFKQLSSGYALRIVESKGGQTPTDTDAVKVHMKIQLDDSLVVDSKELYPIGRRLGMKNMWPEFKAILSQVGNGDSVQIRMGLPEYAKLEGRTAALRDSSQMVTMSMRILDVDNESSLIEKMVNDQLAYEIEQIEKYLVNNNLEAERTEEGIYYIISQQGEGDVIGMKDEVVSNFTLKFLDGEVIGSTKEEVAKEHGLYREGQTFENYVFRLEDSRVEGWTIGLQKFREGTVGTLLIPSRFAYGSRGAGGVIPPNSTLVYDIEVLELNK